MEQLISAQQEMFGRIARTIDTLKKIGTSKITLAFVRASLIILDKKWSKFEGQHTELRREHWESLKDHDYVKSDFLAQAEDTYTQQRAALVEVEQNLLAGKAAKDESCTKVSAAEPAERSSLATLPRIQLPHFSGRVEDWPAFRDLFTSLIGKEGLLSQVEKFHHLRVSVSGSAEEVIRNLPDTGDNFRWAWTMLTNHYEIQKLHPEAQWHHGTGTCNPADCASRGVASSALLSHSPRWKGPDQESREWSLSSPTINETEIPEQRKGARSVEIEPNESELRTRHSALHRLPRVSAGMRRGRTASGGPHRRGQALSPTEATEAETMWVLRDQATAYLAEIFYGRAREPLPSRNPLESLTPHQGEAGTLRVGGRLKHTVLSYYERHPVMLPPMSHLGRRVIDAYLRRTLHGGAHLSLGLIRRRFWMPRGRMTIKGQILHCPPCLPWRAASSQPKMGNLLEARTTLCRPLLKSGVGCAGPIMVRNARGQGHKVFKAVTAIFVCFNSRAVHLQALSDDPKDLAWALTPGHYLIGEPLCSLPEPRLLDAPAGCLNRWQLIQQMRDHLWTRWSQEHVTSLAPNNQWCKEAPKQQEGQLGLARSETSPPSRGPLARITQLHPGEDGKIRVVTVRTATTTLTRPTVKIVPLPFASEGQEGS